MAQRGSVEPIPYGILETGMAENPLGAVRLFPSHYQLVVYDDPMRPLADEENWNHESKLQGIDGAPAFRMIGTKADLNDRRIELYASERTLYVDQWQRVTCDHFRSSTEKVHVMSFSPRLRLHNHWC